MSSGLDFPAPLERSAGKESGPTRPPRQDTKPKPTPAGRQAPLAGRLQEAIGGIGIAVALVNEIDGLAIIEGAERLSHALDKAAKQSPSFRRTIEAALTGGVWAEVIFASGAILVPVALNHGLLPAGLAVSAFGGGNSNGNGPTHPEPESV